LQFRRKSRAEIAINLAPLIDVIFLLVIFFAVSTTFLDTAGLQLELPESSSTAKREAEDITVFLGADGELSFGDEQVDEEQLMERLRAAMKETDRKVVVLRADTHTEHGAVVKIMDLIRDSGAEGLTVAARSAGAD
jgi:biopolymer transport protein ExbD/biopolymer transport protein TolR